ncbi:hypothetical protein BC941DRAFT_409172 [Chlamydoabsidia padenii]|nr:hypothetical protein BC941DRAFT_409172 [Chlamydoabsidia padenii]
MNHNQISLSIQNEFGWTMLDNEPVFGPGSVIQGQVHVLDPLLFIHATRLRLIFHGAERTRQVPIYKNQFFGTQTVLWNSKQPTTTSVFDFTLQLPTVQFPPSMDHPLYNCYFKLSVFLDGKDITASKEITFRPFLETILFKAPLVHTLGPAAQIALYALDYVPGATISIHFTSTSSNMHSVLMALDQTVICSKEKKKTRIVSMHHHPIPGDLCLTLPIDLPPSFSFSPLVAVTYHLIVKLGRSHVVTLPIKIGTLGYGLRASSDLDIYSIFASAFDDASSSNPLPLPVFMKTVEYENALPRYEADRLPAYV